MINMTVIDDKAIKKYLQSTIDKIFKVLPLYEEKNRTLEAYVGSLIIELKGFVASYGNVGITEYMSVIATLEGIQRIVDEKGKQPVIKREVFKCIETIKKIDDMLEGG